MPRTRTVARATTPAPGGGHRPAGARPTLASSALPGSEYTGHYNGLSIGSGGIALTYAGFTVGGNIIGGRENNQLHLAAEGRPAQIGLPGRCEVCRRVR